MRTKKKCVSFFGRPSRQFACVGLAGKVWRTHDPNWEAGHLGDVG